jgi:hypothetical protein
MRPQMRPGPISAPPATRAETAFALVDVAEAEGFEPPVPLGTLAFKASALGRSATLPHTSLASRFGSLASAGRRDGIPAWTSIPMPSSNPRRSPVIGGVVGGAGLAGLAGLDACIAFDGGGARIVGLIINLVLAQLGWERHADEPERHGHGSGRRGERRGDRPELPHRPAREHQSRV